MAKGLAHLSYEKRLMNIGLFNLKRWVRWVMLEVYRITYRMGKVNRENFFLPNTRIQGHPGKLMDSRIQDRKKETFFIQEIIKLLHSLPVDIVMVMNIDGLKRGLSRYMKGGCIIGYTLWQQTCEYRRQYQGKSLVSVLCLLTLQGNRLVIV